MACLPKPKCDYTQHEQALTVLHDAGEVFHHTLWLWWLWPWYQNCEGWGSRPIAVLSLLS